MSYKAEYIWIDGQEPTAKLPLQGQDRARWRRSPVWGFDGSSTNQAPGEASDCVLNPVLVVPDPVRGGGNKLVMCEVLLTDMSPHPSNTRSACAAAAAQYADMDFWFGIEQEYTFFDGIKPWAGPTTVSRRPRADTTAAWVPTRCSVARWWNSTWTPAFTPAWPFRN